MSDKKSIDGSIPANETGSVIDDSLLTAAEWESLSPISKVISAMHPDTLPPVRPSPPGSSPPLQRQVPDIWAMTDPLPGTEGIGEIDDRLAFDDEACQ